MGLLGNLFARIGSGAMPFLLPLFLQLYLGYTSFEAGLALVMLLGVATAGALLVNFEDYFANTTVIAQTASAFHATFIAVGIITLASAWIFWQLSPDEQLGAGKVESADIG